MPIYQAPTRDTRFVINEVLKLESYNNLPGFEAATPDLVDTVVEEFGKFVSEVLAPLNAVGDREGCTRHADGSVTTPTGFAPAVAGTGATVVPVTSVLPDEERGETWPDDPVAGMARFLDEGVHVLPQARAAFDGDRPDVLLGDIGAYAARVLAHRWSRPLVQLSPTYVAWEGYERDNGCGLASHGITRWSCKGHWDWD